MTHTFATLEISAAAYDEIAAKLRAAGYVLVNGVIDMHGIVLIQEPSEPLPLVELTQEQCDGIELHGARLELTCSACGDFF